MHHFSLDGSLPHTLERSHLSEFNDWLCKSDKEIRLEKIAAIALIILSLGIAYLAIALACKIQDLDFDKISNSFAALYRSALLPLPTQAEKNGKSYFCNTLITNSKTNSSVYFGACPEKKQAEWLQSKGCQVVISLIEPKEESIYSFGGKFCSSEDLRNLGMQNYKIAVSKGNVINSITLSYIKQIVESSLRLGHSVYIHCDDGNQRSAAVAVAIRAEFNSINGNSAYEDLKQLRPNIQVSNTQMNYIAYFLEEGTYF